RAFDASLEPIQFALLNPASQFSQLVDRHIERLLRPLGSCPSVAKHARSIALRMQRRINRVTQPALLANFREQSRTRAARKNAHGRPRLKVVGMLVWNRWVSNANVRLIRFERNIVPRRSPVARRRLRDVERLPVAEQLLSHIAKPLPIEVAGHR